MKTWIIVSVMVVGMAEGFSRDEVRPVSPIIESALTALPPRQLDQYKAARSRIEGDYGHAVKVFFANTFIPNDLTKMGLELDFSDALLEPVEKRINGRRHSVNVPQLSLVHQGNLPDYRRRIKDSETVLQLLKGRVQNVPTIWPEIEERLERISALKIRVGD